MPAWYPSLVVSLRLRFDERFHVVQVPPPVSVGQYVAKLAPNPEPMATLRPLIIEGGADNLSVLSNRLPKAASVELLGYRQASKFTLSLDYRDLPIDPRLVRACGVEIHLGAVDPMDFATGMVQVEPDGSRRSVLRPTEDNMLLVGIADSWVVEHTDTSSEVQIEGRNLVGVLIDSPISPPMLQKLHKIDLSKDIIDVVRQIVSLHPFGARMAVVGNINDWPAGKVPSPGAKDGVTRLRLPAAGGKPSSSPPGDGNKLNFWDLITQYCGLVGAVPHFVGQVLRVRPARSLYDHEKNQFDPLFATPFLAGLPREVPVGDPPTFERLTHRRMVYGRDVHSLKLERKLAGTKVPQIEVVSLDTGSAQRGAARLLTVKWPPDPKGKAGTAALTTSVAPSGAASMTDVLRIPVPGVADLAQLREVARNLYEEIGRGEMGGSFTTKNLASFGGDNGDPDLLRLRPGDPMELLIDASGLGGRSPIVAELVDHQRRSFDEEVEAVRARLGGDRNAAQVIVATARGLILELQRLFHSHNVKFDWHSTGVEIASDFNSYLEAAYGVTDSTGENLLPPLRKNAPERTV